MNPLRLIAIHIVLLLFILPVHAQNTYVVDSTNDQDDFTPGDGICSTTLNECTFRAAIQEANATPNGASPDLILFDAIPTTGGFAEITIGALDLPEITEAVYIDAETAPGEVRVRGATTGSQIGLALVVGSGGSKIRGLTLGYFEEFGIIAYANNITITNNYIGITRDGAPYADDVVSSKGIHILGDSNKIGDLGEGNVIGHYYFGIRLLDGHDNIVRSNFVGTDPDGREASNTHGISLVYGSNTIIGGPTRAHGNTIGFNVYTGISYFYPSEGVKIRNNYIGTNEAGDDLGNVSHGISAYASPEATLIGGGKQHGNVIGYNDVGIYAQSGFNKIGGNYIGTNEAGDDLGNAKGIVVGDGFDTQIGYGPADVIPLDQDNGNIIAFNDQEGVLLEPLFYTNTIYATIRGNQIHDNGLAGIDLLGVLGPDLNDIDDADTGANDLMNYPDVIRVDYNGSFDDIGIEYSVSSDPAHVAYPLTVDIYIADDPASGEGKTLIGSDIYTTQNTVQLFTIDATSITWASEDVLVFTVTDSDGKTSEFSPASDEIGGPGFTVSSISTSVRSKQETLYEESTQRPGIFRLKGNYPNPFRSQTTITYELPEQAEITLRIYDSNGQLISDSIYKNQPAGTHQLSYDASQLPSGVYFYRLQTDTSEQTGKMILIR